MVETPFGVSVFNRCNSTTNFINMSLYKIHELTNEHDFRIAEIKEKLSTYVEQIEERKEATNQSLLKYIDEVILPKLNEEADIYGLHVTPREGQKFHTDLVYDVRVDGTDRVIGTIEIGASEYSPVRVCDDTKRPFVYKLFSAEMLEKTGCAFPGELLQAETRYGRRQMHKTKEVVTYKGVDLPLYALGYGLNDDDIKDEDRDKRYVRDFVTDLQASKYRAMRPYFQTNIWSSENRVIITPMTGNQFMGVTTHNGRTNYTNKVIELVQFFASIEESVLPLYIFHAHGALQGLVESLHDIQVLRGDCAREIKALEDENVSSINGRVSAIENDIKRAIESEEGWDFPKSYLTLEQAKETYSFKKGKRILEKTARSYYNKSVSSLHNALPYMDYNEGFNLKLVRWTKSGKSVELEMTQHSLGEKSKLIKAEDLRRIIEGIANEVVEHEIINERPEFFEQEEVQA